MYSVRFRYHNGGNKENYPTKHNSIQIVQPLMRMLGCASLTQATLAEGVMANPNRATGLESAQVLLKSAQELEFGSTRFIATPLITV
jgi:hypothetical protein